MHQNSATVCQTCCQHAEADRPGLRPSQSGTVLPGNLYTCSMQHTHTKSGRCVRVINLVLVQQELCGAPPHHTPTLAATPPCPAPGTRAGCWGRSPAPCRRQHTCGEHSAISCHLLQVARWLGHSGSGRPWACGAHAPRSRRACHTNALACYCVLTSSSSANQAGLELAHAKRDISPGAAPQQPASLALSPTLALAAHQARRPSSYTASVASCSTFVLTQTCTSTSVAFARAGAAYRHSARPDGAAICGRSRRSVSGGHATAVEALCIHRALAAIMDTGSPERSALFRALSRRSPSTSMCCRICGARSRPAPASLRCTASRIWGWAGTLSG